MGRETFLNSTFFCCWWGPRKWAVEERDPLYNSNDWELLTWLQTTYTTKLTQCLSLKPWRINIFFNIFRFWMLPQTSAYIYLVQRRSGRIWRDVLGWRIQRKWENSVPCCLSTLLVKEMFPVEHVVMSNVLLKCLHPSTPSFSDREINQDFCSSPNIR